MTRPPPRLYVIPAILADVAAVIRRGPSDWCHVGRWHLDPPRFEPGAWFRGTIPPQKCDLSPDGRWLAYSASKYPGAWEAGSVYEAVSLLPWLRPVAAWAAGTTYTRGCHFVTEPGRNDLGLPSIGTPDPVLGHFGLALTGADQFAVERRRGWNESETSPDRSMGGPWDEDRRVEMRKGRPTDEGGDDPRTVLRVSGAHAAFRTMPGWRDPAEYWIEHDRELVPLPDAQWADWDREGRLLLATVSGRLQVRVGEPTESMPLIFDEDLAPLEPNPQPPPPAASQW